MYLQSKTSEALENCLSFASTVLSFEIMELWLSIEEEHQCIFAYSPKSFQELHPNLVTGFWPEFSEVQYQSLRVCNQANDHPGQCYWHLTTSEESQFPNQLKIMTEFAFELVKDSANVASSRLYLIAFATKPIRANPAKMKFIEGLTYAIQCAAFGFDDEDHNSSARDFTERVNKFNGRVDSTLDLKNFNPSEPVNSAVETQANEDECRDAFEDGKSVSDSAGNISRGIFPFASIMERKVSSKTSGRILSLAVERSISSKVSESKGENRRHPRLESSSSDSGTSIKRNNSTGITFFKQASFTLGGTTVAGSDLNTSLPVISKSVPTWEPTKSFHFPIACLPVKAIDGFDSDLTLDCFTDLRHLADGSNANVFLGKLNDASVIIKMMKETAVNNPVAVHEFDLEHGLLARMDHPNIIKILGSGNNPRRFLVLEYMQKGTLNDILKKHNVRDDCTLPERLFRKPSFTYKELITHAKEIAMAFDYIHRTCYPDAVILHRDLKPDNIGFDRLGHAKLMDFGLGVVIKASMNADEVFEMSGFTGSLRYMAPEVALRESYNEKADVYSYGILLWQMASDRLPFADNNRESFVQAVAIGGERPELDPLWPLAFRNLLTKCWANAHRERPSFQEIVEQLDGLLTVAAEPHLKSGKSIRAMVVSQKACCAW